MGIMSLGLVGVVFLAYFRITGYDFINLDDGQHLYQNPLMLLPTWETLSKFWTGTYFYLYIPITYTVWWVWACLSHAIWDGLNPGFFHFLNLSLHAVDTILVFFFIEMLLQRGLQRGWGNSARKKGFGKNKTAPDPWIIAISCFVGALFFALHPVQVETVTWIACLKDLLSTLFALIALFVILKAPPIVGGKGTPDPRGDVIATLFFTLSLFSKPGTLVLPVTAIVLDYVLSGRPILKARPIFWMWMVLGVVVTIVTKSVQPNARILHVVPILDRILVATRGVWHYVFKIIFPYPLLIDYALPVNQVLESDWIWVCWIVPVVLGLYAWFKKGPILIGAAIFGLAILPVLGLIPFEFQNFSIVADHYLYFALIGVSFILSYFLYLWINWIGPAPVLASCSVVLVALIVVTEQYIPVWENSVLLYNYELQYRPDSYLAEYGLGKHYEERRSMGEALPHLLEAHRIFPRSIPATRSVSEAYLAQKRYAEDETFLGQIFKEQLPGTFEPTRREFATLRNEYGVALASQGKLEAAKEQFQLALSLDPASLAARKNLEEMRMRK